jgi:hypothetical protein
MMAAGPEARVSVSISMQEPRPESWFFQKLAPYGSPSVTKSFALSLRVGIAALLCASSI